MMKTTNTKHAMLMSAIALLLCISMFIGSTFAWFTDSVTSAGNVIQSGTLDVDLVDDAGISMAGKVIDFVAADGRDQDAILWEPGCTYETEPVYVVNNGNLALKYEIAINGITGDAKLLEAIEWTVTVGGTTTAIADLKGELSPEESSDAIVLSGHMKEEAGNEYQNLTVNGISIAVFATQLANESDSFDNTYDEVTGSSVAYDDTLTVAENAAALQAVLDAASEGDIILVGAGNWYATKYQPFTIETDGITLVGETGTVFGFETENVNSILDVYGDNVTIRNIVFNENKNEFNQCILAIGAENLTVDGCTFYGENYEGGNTPTLGVYIFENLDATGESGDAVTKYTITNNNFFGAAIGSYKGGANTVPADPGVAAAQVSEDMVIANNTFDGGNILIENWRSWSKEANRDHKFVPTIVNNTFKAPNLCFANTPHSIYLRCYRQGDPEKILPAGYIDAFVANNTIKKPTNDTVVNGYVLSDEYGAFFRDNATYGNIAYCYGQNFKVD